MNAKTRLARAVDVFKRRAIYRKCRQGSIVVMGETRHPGAGLLLLSVTAFDDFALRGYTPCWSDACSAARYAVRVFRMGRILARQPEPYIDIRVH
jgi:hypothetical protein